MEKKIRSFFNTALTHICDTVAKCYRLTDNDPKRDLCVKTCHDRIAEICDSNANVETKLHQLLHFMSLTISKARTTIQQELEPKIAQEYISNMRELVYIKSDLYGLLLELKPLLHMPSHTNVYTNEIYIIYESVMADNTAVKKSDIQKDIALGSFPLKISGDCAYQRLLMRRNLFPASLHMRLVDLLAAIGENYDHECSDKDNLANLANGVIMIYSSYATPFEYDYRAMLDTKDKKNVNAKSDTCGINKAFIHKTNTIVHCKQDGPRVVADTIEITKLSEQMYVLETFTGNTWRLMGVFDHTLAPSESAVIFSGMNVKLNAAVELNHIITGAPSRAIVYNETLERVIINNCLEPTARPILLKYAEVVNAGSNANYKIKFSNELSNMINSAPNRRVFLHDLNKSTIIRDLLFRLFYASALEKNLAGCDDVFVVNEFFISYMAKLNVTFKLLSIKFRAAENADALSSDDEKIVQAKVEEIIEVMDKAKVWQTLEASLKDIYLEYKKQ